MVTEKIASYRRIGTLEGHRLSRCMTPIYDLFLHNSEMGEFAESRRVPSKLEVGSKHLFRDERYLHYFRQNDIQLVIAETGMAVAKIDILKEIETRNGNIGIYIIREVYDTPKEVK